MKKRENMLVSKLIERVLKEMACTGYSCGTIKIFRRVYNRLETLAELNGNELYDNELADKFLTDVNHAKSKEYCHSRFLLHNKCIYFLKSYIETGNIDWSERYKKPEREKLTNLKAIWEDFCLKLNESTLKMNTIDGYMRIVLYFLQYCESKNYQSLNDIQPGNVITFIEMLCEDRYQPTSLGAHLPGLKLFLESNDTTKVFVNEIQLRIQRKRNIIPVLDDKEQNQLISYLECEKLSYRDKAICLLSLETGLRAVDICALRLEDVNWTNDCIHIIQQKTNKTLNIPLMPSFGNAISDYLVYERPISKSKFIFLQTKAPFNPIITHAACWKILHNAFEKAGILKEGRICGTRLTRHNAASRMLRKGIPLTTISAVLGHYDPNSVNIYLTTDENKLTECTLPLPVVIIEKEVELS